MINIILKLLSVVICILFLESFSYIQDDYKGTTFPQLPPPIECIQYYKDTAFPQLPPPIECIKNNKLSIIKYVQPPVRLPVAKPSKPVPEWILKGILMRESSSYYTSSGSIRYINKKTLSAGAIGPFQMKDDAFSDVRENGEDFIKLKSNMKFAEDKACDYLLFLYKNFAHYNWDKTIMMYNQGIRGYITNKQEALEYLNLVKKYGKKSDK